ncbi:zinc finger, RING/FYVE/PHD-type containing protein [Tanacetum coccineum]
MVSFELRLRATNPLVLTSLEPLDYAFVAFLPDISEELLFRVALLPLIGINLISATVVAALFGILHLGSGRKFSFATWATFVGLAYGYAMILTSSLIVPMASHAINNLIGGVIWLINHQKRETLSRANSSNGPRICHMSIHNKVVEGTLGLIIRARVDTHVECKTMVTVVEVDHWLDATAFKEAIYARVESLLNLLLSTSFLALFGHSIWVMFISSDQNSAKPYLGAWRDS